MTRSVLKRLLLILAAVVCVYALAGVVGAPSVVLAQCWGEDCVEEDDPGSAPPQDPNGGTCEWPDIGQPPSGNPGDWCDDPYGGSPGNPTPTTPPGDEPLISIHLTW